MKEKLDKIYEFLLQNRQYNHALQEKSYKYTILPHQGTTEKIMSLLYNTANTQSQPKIDSLASFFKGLNENTRCLDSMRSFIESISPGKPCNFDSLYSGLEKQPGFGEKTAALFTKKIYHLHNDQYSETLRVWDDVPKTISEKDNFYLPVDRVIISIFRKMDAGELNFKQINKLLKNNYKSQEIEVWDDLWFWGFITQHGSGTDRTFMWNENKYWNLHESDKNPESIREIKGKAELFLTLL